MPNEDAADAFGKIIVHASGVKINKRLIISQPEIAERKDQVPHAMQTPFASELIPNISSVVAQLTRAYDYDARILSIQEQTESS